MSDKITFGTFGRYTEISVDQMTPEQKKGYEYVVKERGEAPGPYKIILQNPNLLQVLVPVGRYFQQSHSSLSDAEREILVNSDQCQVARGRLELRARDDRGKSGPAA